LLIFFIFFFSCIYGRSVEHISFSQQIVTDSIFTKIKKTKQDFFNDLNEIVINFGGISYFFYDLSYKSIYEYLINNKKEYKKITFDEFVYILSNLEKEIYNHNL